MATRLGERAARFEQLNEPRTACLGFRPTACRDRTTRSDRDVAWTRWNEIAARPDDPARGGAARCPVRQQPVSDRNSPTEPDFYDRSMASRSRCRRAPTSQPSSPPCDPARATARRRPPWQRRCAGSSAGWRSTVAVADIAGAWPLEQVTGALSAFASRLPGRADRFDPAAARPRRPARPSAAIPQAAALTVLGMGKLGAGELNYSSDIDLILLYDRDAAGARRQRAAVAALRARRARMLVQLMSETLGRRLHLPHRPAAAPRSRLDAARHVGAGGRALLRERRPELGTRRHDQGAPGGRRPRRRRRPSSATSRPTSGASISTSRPSTTSIRSSARSTPIAAAAPSRCWATTSSSAAAASARSSSSPRPSS